MPLSKTKLSIRLSPYNGKNHREYQTQSLWRQESPWVSNSVLMTARITVSIRLSPYNGKNHREYQTQSLWRQESPWVSDSVLMTARITVSIKLNPTIARVCVIWSVCYPNQDLKRVLSKSVFTETSAPNTAAAIHDTIDTTSNQAQHRGITECQAI